MFLSPSVRHGLSLYVTATVFAVARLDRTTTQAWQTWCDRKECSTDSGPIESICRTLAAVYAALLQAPSGQLDNARFAIQRDCSARCGSGLSGGSIDSRQRLRDSKIVHSVFLIWIKFNVSMALVAAVVQLLLPIALIKI